MTHSQPIQYHPPAGQVGLTGPVAMPVGRHLPLRGDLAHIALADRYLVAAYAVPTRMQIGREATALHAARDAASETIVTLEPGAAFEALDVTESWVWGCCGPDGPAGYIVRGAFA